MKKSIALLMIAIYTSLLLGCTTIPTVVTNTVKVPVPVACNITAPDKPYMPYTEAKKNEVPEKERGDIFFWVKLLLAEIKERMGYEAQLEAAIKACNDKVVQ